MPSIYSSESFAALSERFEAIVASLAAQGVTVPNTRIDRYRRYLLDLVARASDVSLVNEWSQLSDNERVIRTRKALSVLFELQELDLICRDSIPARRSEVLNVIRRIAQGPDGYEEERATSTFPRDLLFELQVARVFASAGLTTLNLPPADLALEVNNRYIVVECKRPQSERGIVRKLRQGFTQVRRRIKERPGSRIRGIVALDLSKAINPRFDQLHIEDHTKIGALYSDILDEAAATIMGAIGPSDYCRTLAIFLRFSAISIDKTRWIPIYGVQHLVLSLPQNRASDAELRDSIGRRLQPPCP